MPYQGTHARQQLSIAPPPLTREAAIGNLTAVFPPDETLGVAAASRKWGQTSAVAKLNYTSYADGQASHCTMAVVPMRDGGRLSRALAAGSLAICSFQLELLLVFLQGCAFC